MPFIDISRALFAYSPQSSDELQIEEDDLLYVLEKGDDDWWKVKKKVPGDDDGPVGLVPQNYLEQVAPNKPFLLWLTLMRSLRYPPHGHSTITLPRQKRNSLSPRTYPLTSTTKTTLIGSLSVSNKTTLEHRNTALCLRIISMTEKSRVLRNYPLYCLLNDLRALMSGDP